MAINVSFAISGQRLVGSVTSVGQLGVENGLLLQSRQYALTGQTDIDLGAIKGCALSASTQA